MERIGFIFLNNIIFKAEKYYGIFQVAAVNCETEEELCQDEFSVYDCP